MTTWRKNAVKVVSWALLSGWSFYRGESKAGAGGPSICTKQSAANGPEQTGTVDLEGEYVDMAELLKDNVEADSRREWTDPGAMPQGDPRLQELDAILQRVCYCSVCQVPTKGKGVVGIPGPNDS